MKPPGPERLVHELALCESTDVGDGTRIGAFAHILPGARVGAGCDIGEYVYVEGGAAVGDRVTVASRALIFSGVTIDDDVVVGANAIFTNDRRPRTRALRRDRAWVMAPTHVRAGASIGARAVVVCGTTVGAAAIVGAGSVVTSDVDDHAVVEGIPARWTAWACACGARLDGDLTCACGRRYEVDADGGLCDRPGGGSG